MVELRDGNNYEANSAPYGKAAGTDDTARKRKAPSPLPREGGPSANQSPPEAKRLRPQESNNASSHTNVCDAKERPRTPPPVDASQLQPRTPGRVGPIKKECNCKPDIKPFRGEPGRKVRKTAAEKEREYTDFVRQHEGHPFYELHVCYDKGPNGSPTYDKAGFELDYKKVAKWMKPSYRKPRNNNYADRMIAEGKRKHELFFGTSVGSDIGRFNMEAADRVSKDLQIPYHKVGLAEFEEWDRRGFPKPSPDDFASPTQAERERLMRLATGASLRK